MPSQNEDRSAHARIAAFSRSAREPSGEAMTKTARNAYRDSFKVRHECKLCGTVEVDQDLPAKEIARIAEAAYRAHMTRLSHRREVMRNRAEQATAAAEEADEQLRRLADAV